VFELPLLAGLVHCCFDIGIKVRSILCFGDSNSFGTMPVKALGVGPSYALGIRWPDVMISHLPKWRIEVQSQPGRTTLHNDPIEGAHLNGLRILPALLESYAQLDLVILKLGTNDLKTRFSVTAQDITQSCERLIQEVLKVAKYENGHAPQILLICPPPIK
jgi:lysophospholipase L1-like esterase|tara:strand:- start:104 stop:586 length:483 start_codon:yes stop_codon:yes gene_type:complete